MRHTYKILGGLVILVSAIQFACSKPNADAAAAPESEWLSGGAQTAYDAGNGAFGHAFTGMSDRLLRVHEIGDLQFEATFVSAPSPRNPGLGPLFNNVSCASCHVGDGRGKVASSGESAVLMLFRVSIAGQNAHGGPNPVPGFGDQLQTAGTFGVQREASVKVTYAEKAGAFDDGVAYSLRFPSFSVDNPYTTFPANAMLSPRVAQPVFGLGLLESISEADILSHADEQDKDGDGISGKPNYVWNIAANASTLGRFGWKANQPSLMQQVGAAYSGDIGITTSVFPQESSFGQPQYSHWTDATEITDSILNAVHFYIRTLAVPVRRNVTDATVQQGKALFASAGCAKCHMPDMRTAVDVSLPALSNQLIHPYSDLLLHDMGEDLADNRPDFLATGREWRTQPLWGIGLTSKVNGHTNFLHDGRARSLLEAVLWHGGEAEAARNKVKAMSAGDRAALVKFLESL